MFREGNNANIMKKDTEKISKGPTFFGHGAVPRTEGHVSLELNILDLTVIDDILFAAENGGYCG